MGRCGNANRVRAAEQIVGRDRRERVSQLAWRGEGCFDSRRRVNSDVRRVTRNEISCSKRDRDSYLRFVYACAA